MTVGMLKSSGTERLRHIHMYESDARAGESVQKYKSETGTSACVGKVDSSSNINHLDLKEELKPPVVTEFPHRWTQATAVYQLLHYLCTSVQATRPSSSRETQDPSTFIITSPPKNS